MRYLQTAFAGEGGSDFEFLKPVSQRLVEDILLSDSLEDVEIAPVLDIKPSGKFGNKPDGVVDEVVRSFSYIDILFYHSDSAGDVDAAYQYRVNIVAEGLKNSNICVVGVVPKREMEAWVIADPGSLLRVLGLIESTKTPPVFSPKRVEHVTDPKAGLRDFLSDTPYRAARAGDPEEGVLSAAALSADLDVLRGVPQFRRFEDDLRVSLRTLNLL